MSMGFKVISNYLNQIWILFAHLEVSMKYNVNTILGVACTSKSSKTYRITIRHLNPPIWWIRYVDTAGYVTAKAICHDTRIRIQYDTIRPDTARQSVWQTKKPKKWRFLFLFCFEKPEPPFLPPSYKSRNQTRVWWTPCPQNLVDFFFFIVSEVSLTYISIWQRMPS